MGARHRDRIWLAGGVVAAVLLLAIAWFFLVSPERGDAAAVREQTTTAMDRVAVLRQKLDVLRKQNAHLATYQARLAELQAALPSQPSLSAFLRQVQQAGTDAGTVIDGFTAGLPISVVGDDKAYALQVSVTADGSNAQLEALLNLLQRVQPRAVLVSSITAAVGTKVGAPDNTVTLTVTMQVFVSQLPAK